jgi:diguanylate cyclase (GGDEF)-like protein
LLVSFGLLSLVPIALLAFVLGRTVNGIITQRTIAQTRATTAFATRFGIQAYLNPAALRRGIDPDQRAEMDRALSGATGSWTQGGAKAHVIVWSAFRVPLYDSLHGYAFSSPPPEVSRALEGRDAWGIRKLDGEHDLVVAVPIRFAPGKPPIGAVEVISPYSRIQQDVWLDVRKIYLVILGGLALLWAVLFPIVARASNQLRRQAAEHERLAKHDGLTGLANRTLFSEELEAALERRPTGVLMIDLDDFKLVNDSYGHHNGDLVLLAVARRLHEAVRDEDTVARLGGDEFGLVAPGLTREELEAVARRIEHTIAQPIAVEGQSFRVTGSVGIALSPDDGIDSQGLLRAADAAMYRAKKLAAPA